MTMPGQYIDPNPPTTLAQVLASTDAAPIFLLEVEAGITMHAWYPLVANGHTYGSAYAHVLGDGSGQLNDSVDIITGVIVNGVELTAGASVDDVVNHNGYWFWDGAASQSLIISMPDGSNPMARGVTVEAMATMYFSDGPTDAGGFAWQARISSWPGLSRSVTADFSSITQVGGGSIELANADHYFDQRRTYNWDAGWARLIMGAAGLPWDQFVPLATFVVSSTKAELGKFTLNVQDPKVLCDTLFPTALYALADYPAMDTGSVGKPLQLSYGVIVGASPVCIDTVNGVFKLAGHPITSVQQVRVKDSSDIWQVAAFFALDAVNATITMDPGVTWEAGQDIVVDFTGKPLPNGQPMINPADIVQDIIEQLGFDVSTAGFLAAHNWYDIGYYWPNPLNRAVTHQLGIYINSQGQAITTINEICVNVRAYLQTATDGTFTLTPFRSYRRTECLQITDTNNLQPGVVIDGSGTTSTMVQAGTKISQCVVTYGVKSSENTQQVATITDMANQYSRGLAAPVQETVDALFSGQDDAAWLGQAIVNQDRVDQSFWTAQTMWSAWTQMPGQGVQIYSTLLCVDQVNEIIKVDLDLNKRQVTLTMDNLRGFERSSGFWCLSTDTTPLGNPLAWNGTGELNDASGEGEYKRQQAGHWVDGNDFAVDTQQPGALYSELDYAPSRWQ